MPALADGLGLEAEGVEESQVRAVEVRDVRVRLRQVDQQGHGGPHVHTGPTGLRGDPQRGEAGLVEGTDLLEREDPAAVALAGAFGDPREHRGEVAAQAGQVAGQVCGALERRDGAERDGRGGGRRGRVRRVGERHVDLLGPEAGGPPGAVPRVVGVAGSYGGPR